MRRQHTVQLFLVGSFSIVALIYAFHNSSSDYGTQESQYRIKNSILQDKILVRMEEIVKGKPIELKQDEPKLLSFIRSRKYLHPPSTLDYNLTEPDKDPSMGQSKAVLQILGNMTNGIFVECGALDGETRSNTLFLEKELGWKGLLIEGDPSNFQKVILKNRKAWAAKACLAIKNHPHEVIFKQDFNIGKIESNIKKERKGYVRVQCFPFFSLVSAVNITHVDYFSLDVEGSELQVLKTIPFESIMIKVLSVEFHHVHGGRSSLKSFMAKKGYKFVMEVKHANNLANDLIFVHPNVTVKNIIKPSAKPKTILRT